MNMSAWQIKQGNLLLEDIKLYPEGLGSAFIWDRLVWEEGYGESIEVKPVAGEKWSVREPEQDRMVVEVPTGWSEYMVRELLIENEYSSEAVVRKVH